jgi:hypothetical protein
MAKIITKELKAVAFYCATNHIISIASGRLRQALLS